MSIKNVYVFDDQKIDDVELFIKELQKALRRRANSNKTYFNGNYTFDKDVKVSFFTFENGASKKFFWQENNGEISIEDDEWGNNLWDHFEDDYYLVLCDFVWVSTERETQIDINYIFGKLKNKKNVIFVCYSSVEVENPEEWIANTYREIQNGDATCFLQPELLSLPKAAKSKIRVILDTVDYDWVSKNSI